MTNGVGHNGYCGTRGRYYNVTRLTAQPNEQITRENNKRGSQLQVTIEEGLIRIHLCEYGHNRG